MLALSGDDLKHLVTMRKAIDLVGLAFTELSQGRALAPLRTPIKVQPEGATTLVMPAFVPGAGALGVKVVSVFAGNVDRGLPTITALVAMFDQETGQPLAIMDGGFLTALRTGAVSGAATEILAREDATVLTVIGAGAQAVTQALAVAEVRRLDHINVVARSRASQERFVTTVERDWPTLAPLLRIDLDLAAAVQEADIICAATTSRKPVFDDADVRPGTHINGVGAFTPEMQEIPAETIARAVVVVDQRKAALEEAGDLLQPLHSGMVDDSHYARELGQLLSGSVTGRDRPDQVTVFKSVGNAIQDVAVGRFAIDEAVRQQVGQRISLF
ncbi:MAG TPA: ornithine cyclodeaminase [Thermomicrobiales bacterium]|nr:ornithine cyclodeaminase [Thermomicrobiales bacterium]